MQIPTTQLVSVTAHTPGPWVWHDGHTLRAKTPNPGASSVHTILSSSGQECGYLGSDFRQTTAELEADRRLIAAAPELLAVLQWIDALVSRDEGVDGSELDAISTKCREAFEKVTGGVA